MVFDSPFSTSLFAFLFQFENGRFEMIIIMPRNHRGLAFFHNEAKTRLQDSSFDGNILDEALDALERRRTVHEVHVINMPSFKVDTNMDVQKHLRTVNQFIHPHYHIIRLVLFLGPGKNRTMQNSYYIANCH